MKLRTDIDFDSFRGIKSIERIYDDYETKGGIFSKKIRYPWSATIDCDTINEMFLNEYGSCLASRYITKLFNENEELTTENRQKLSVMIASRYLLKWEKLWETLHFNYNPISNYDMTESERTETDNLTNAENSKYTTDRYENTRTYNLSDSVSGQETQTNNLSEQLSNTNTKNLTDTQEITVNNTNSNTANHTENTYAFNSVTAVPESNTTESRSDTINQTSEDTMTHTGTDTNTGTKTNTGTVSNDIDTTTTKTGTEEDENERSITETDNTRTTEDGTVIRTLTRSGNIGVLTSQQMIQSQRDLWQWDFLKEVFTDVAKLIIIPIY